MAIRGGAYWERTMREARIQAQTYARALPPWEGWPPFLIVVDVGHSIELFADFSLSGTRYSHFPDQSSSRICSKTSYGPKSAPSSPRSDDAFDLIPREGLTSTLPLCLASPRDSARNAR